MQQHSVRGHGCVVTGRTVRDAVRISVYLMVNARLQTEAMRFGEVAFLSENEVAATAEMSSSPLVPLHSGFESLSVT
jgi:ribulose-5-phosphate 4-epimerase/fuculose-1-phosphate aldolase